MKTIIENHSVDWNNCNTDFYREIVNNLPIPIYINQIDRPGDICSFRNIWMNRFGLDLIGFTREELKKNNYDLFREMIHPTDLELLEVSLKEIFISGSPKRYESALRIKPKGSVDYCLFRCVRTVLNTFGDGTIKQVLVAAFELASPDNQLDMAMNEISRLECILKMQTLSVRETAIVHLIVKGMTDKEIAEKLCVSHTTIRTHRHKIIQKMGVHNSVELGAMAVESGEF